MTTALGRDRAASAHPQLWRISDQATFAALRREGRRARRGPLTLTWLAPAALESDHHHPRVAFAIGRSTGNAVVRNRIRRRLRAALQELLAAGHLPLGAYLISGSAELARVPWVELRASLEAAIASVTAATR